MLLALTTKPAFKSFLETIQGRPGPAGVSLDSLLVTPLKRISSYIQDLQELKAHTPTEHVDYVTITETITELEFIQKVSGSCTLITMETRTLSYKHHQEYTWYH